MVYRTTRKMAQRKEARRRRLLREAIGIFSRKGYHATTVPMIVTAADSSIGSFYFYFRNKEDIFAAALRGLGEEISSALNQAIGTAGTDVFLQMRAAMKALVRFLAEHPEEARILIVESSGLGQRLETVRRQIIASHTRSVEQALGTLAKRLPPMEPSIVASCWVGAVHEAVFHWLQQPPAQRLPSERLADAIAGFNLRAIGAPAEVVAR
jgi:TetR/AcrR family transcriptional regulator, fatty acid metabolism regulator protein